jgi:predicted metal-dependent peptidase
MHDLQRKLVRSKVRLMVDKDKNGLGFYASILYKMPLVVKNEIPTMATDGTNIFYNEEFTDNLTEPELDFVLCHECLHRVLLHHLRFGKRDHELWNIATDYAINFSLTQSGLFSMPEGGLLDKRFANMKSEKIYDILKEESKTKPKPKPQSWGNVIPQEGKTEDQIKQEIATINAETMMAVNTAKAIGNLPSSVKDIINEMKRSQVDWTDVLRRHCVGDQPEGYSFRRPNRRQWHINEIITPISNKVGVGDIVIGVDTSGSVSNKELSYFLGELNSLSDEVKPNSITIITCDAQIQDVVKYESGETVKDIVCKGRGGTCVMPVFDYIAKENLNVDSFIYFTDLGIHDFPVEEPNYPVLWVSTDTRQNEAPIGTTTYLKVA